MTFTDSNYRKFVWDFDEHGATLSHAQLLEFTVTPTPQSELQTIAIDATGGTWTFTLNGETTAPIAFDATASDVQDAIVALPSVAAGDLGGNWWYPGENGGGVKGGPGNAGGTTPYKMPWARTLGNVSTPVLDATSLTGGAGTATVTTVQTGSAGPTGTFTVTLPAELGGGTTDPIDLHWLTDGGQYPEDFFVNDIRNAMASEITGDGAGSWDIVVPQGEVHFPTGDPMRLKYNRVVTMGSPTVDDDLIVGGSVAVTVVTAGALNEIEMTPQDGLIPEGAIAVSTVTQMVTEIACSDIVAVAGKFGPGGLAEPGGNTAFTINAFHGDPELDAIIPGEVAAGITYEDYLPIIGDECTLFMSLAADSAISAGRLCVWVNLFFGEATA